MPKTATAYRLTQGEWTAIRQRVGSARTAAFASVQTAEGVLVVAFLGYTITAVRENGDVFMRCKSDSLDGALLVVHRMIADGASEIVIGGTVVGAPDGRYIAHGVPTHENNFAITAWCRAEELGD